MADKWQVVWVDTGQTVVSGEPHTHGRLLREALGRNATPLESDRTTQGSATIDPEFEVVRLVTHRGGDFASEAVKQHLAAKFKLQGYDFVDALDEEDDYFTY